MNKVTMDQLLELITDIAYEQATRECSGIDWFKDFLKKIEDMQKD